MLDDTDYDEILQKISLMFLPDVSNLNELVIRKNKKTTSYKVADILLAYNMLCSGKDIKNNEDIRFVYKNDDIRKKSESYVMDLLYS